MRLYLVRHGKAGDRYEFAGDDLERPLSPAGRRQAQAIALQLSGCDPVPAALLTSPAVRCRQTLEPLSDRLGLSLETHAFLEEGADVAVALERLAARPEPAVAACSHGDVIWGVLEWLARSGVDLGERPDVQKGATWAVDLSGADMPRRAEYLPPPTVPSGRPSSPRR
ncbi:MAG TPA: phosphoglycerate mutase family protein [Acidimicrobiales bacterium]|nr:phosphoglycerate mutase family protein [Acidimicrobiales bacterium]